MILFWPDFMLKENANLQDAPVVLNYFFTFVCWTFIFNSFKYFIFACTLDFDRIYNQHVVDFIKIKC